MVDRVRVACGHLFGKNAELFLDLANLRLAAGKANDRRSEQVCIRSDLGWAVTLRTATKTIWKD